LMDFGTGRPNIGTLSTRQQINYIMHMTAEGEGNEPENFNTNTG